VIQRIHYKEMTSIMPSVPNWLRIGTGRGILWEWRALGFIP